MSNKEIDIPKNIRQIGHTLTDNKIYIEDYVMTYFRQLYREPFEREKYLVLVGRKLCKDGKKYSFIKGVIEIDNTIKKYSEILENENIRKITRVKEDFFYEEDIIGLGIIIKDEWLGFDKNIRECFCSSFMGDTVIIYDANEEERVYTYSNIGFIKEKGYYIYYDRNESMQNYMLCMKDGKSIEYGYSSTEVVDKTIDEKIRSFTIPKNAVYTSRNISFNKYKNYFEGRFGKRLRYCSVVVCLAILLYAGVAKIEEVERNTKRKAKDLYDVTKEVINQNNEVLEVETVIEGEEESKENQDVDYKIKKKKDDVSEREISETEEKVENKETEIKEKEKKDSEEIKEKKIEPKVTDNKENRTDNKYKVYIVKKGDALVDISKKIYGTIKKVEVIKKVNDLKDEDKIYIGQRLIMP